MSREVLYLSQADVERVALREAAPTLRIVMRHQPLVGHGGQAVEPRRGR